MVKQYRQNRTFENSERKFYQQIGGDDTKHTNNRMQEKLNNFRVKYGNQENMTKKQQMYKQHDERVRRTRRRTESGNTHRLTAQIMEQIHFSQIWMTLTKYQIGKHQATMEYMNSDSRNSPPSTTDKHSKWTDVYKKYMYSNGWPKEGQH